MSLTVKTMTFSAVLLLLFSSFCSAVVTRYKRADGAKLVIETGDSYESSTLVTLQPLASKCIKNIDDFGNSFVYQYENNATNFSFKLCKKADIVFCWLWQTQRPDNQNKVGFNIDCPTNDCFITVRSGCDSKNEIIDTAMMVVGAPYGADIGVYGVTFRNCGTTGIVGFGDSKTSKKKGHGSAANIRQTNVDGACLQAVALTTIPYDTVPL